jgi:hypothetical protein
MHEGWRGGTCALCLLCPAPQVKMQRQATGGALLIMHATHNAGTADSNSGCPT